MSQATYVGYQLRNKQWFVFMCRIYMECCIADNQAKQDLIYTICSCMNCRGFLLFLLILQSFSFCVLPDPVIRYMFLQNMYRELPLSQPRFWLLGEDSEEDIRFSDDGVLAFFRSWNFGGLLLLRSKLF